MKEFVSSLWAILKMLVLFTVLSTVVVMMGLVKYVENNYDKVLIFGGTILVFYILKKGVDHIFWWLKQPKVVKKTEDNEPKSNDEVSYIQGLINDIKSKGRLTQQDKDRIDLLKIKLTQLTNT